MDEGEEGPLKGDSQVGGVVAVAESSPKRTLLVEAHRRFAGTLPQLLRG
jgi:hypothetical protein